MDVDRTTLRALLWCSAVSVAVLDKGMAIVIALRLIAKHHRSAESHNITLIEY